MERYFTYVEMGEHGPETAVVSKTEIIKTYYPYWIEKIKEKYGEESKNFTEEDCIDDWKVLHWAYEI